MRLSLYASQYDLKAARFLVDYLKKQGQSAALNSPPETISRADAVLVLLSPVTLTDDTVPIAVQTAHSFRAEIIPILISGDTVPALFEPMGVVDIRHGKLRALRERLILLYGDDGQARRVPMIPAQIWALLTVVMGVGFVLAVMVFRDMGFIG